MSVRKRAWTTRRGERREAWIVDYVDQDGGRHIETFERKKDADAYHGTVTVDVTARSGGMKVLTRARATVRLP